MVRLPAWRLQESSEALQGDERRGSKTCLIQALGGSSTPSTSQRSAGRVSTAVRACVSSWAHYSTLLSLFPPLERTASSQVPLL